MTAQISAPIIAATGSGRWRPHRPIGAATGPGLPYID